MMLSRSIKSPIGVFVACMLLLASVNSRVLADDRGIASCSKSEGTTDTGTEDDAWMTDIHAFESFLQNLVTGARIPTIEDFKQREADRDWTVITDGGGGVLDFNPGKETVQFRVNEALKGKTVRWEFELGSDAAYSHQVGLTPAGVPEAVEEGKAVPFFTAVYFKKHLATMPETDLKKGERIVLKGSIGDARKNHDIKSFHGATAIYYLEDIPHPIVFVGLDQVKITRVEPTEEELAVHVLSDKPSLDRESWKVVAVNDRPNPPVQEVRQAFDGKESTVFSLDRSETGSRVKSSLLVDMGRSRTVFGIRYLPPQNRDAGGPGGKFSLYVSESPNAMGTPVCNGSFTPFPVEQERSFEKVSGRYFKFVSHSSAEGRTGIAIAELNLLGSAVEIPDLLREPRLPPLAEEIERFELLHENLAEPSKDLQLTPDQDSRWRQVHAESRKRWYRRQWKPLSDLFRSQQWSAVSQAAAGVDASPVQEANFYSVAASPDLSSAEQRAEMIAMSKEMRTERRAFLSAIKRILSADQQSRLKALIARDNDQLESAITK